MLQSQAVTSACVKFFYCFYRWLSKLDNTSSDKRVKKNIKENVPGLAFINKLKPVTYNLDLNAIDKIVQRPVIKDKDGKPFNLHNRN
jgi:hypothetical protein